MEASNPATILAAQALTVSCIVWTRYSMASLPVSGGAICKPLWDEVESPRAVGACRGSLGGSTLASKAL